MATVFDMMRGHVVAQARAIRAQGNRVSWPKILAIAIHSRRSRFTSDVSYLALARELEVAAQAQLRREARDRAAAIRRAKRAKRRMNGVILSPKSHRWVDATQYQPGHRLERRSAHVVPVSPPQTPGVEKIRFRSGGSTAILATPEVKQAFAMKGWRVSV